MIRRVFVPFFAMVSLFFCLASPFFFFWGKVSERSYKWIFLWASIFWFVLATVWAMKKKRDQDPE